MLKNLCIILFFFTLNLNASTYILVSKDVNDLKIEVPDNSEASFIITCKNLNEAQEYIIKNVYSKSKEEITDDIIIYLRQGVYLEEHFLWKATSPTKKIKILAYNNEKVIFNGKRSNGTLEPIFFELENKNGRTNLWIEGITIQNYVNGIWLGNTIRDSLGVYFKGVQNSHNVIRNNTFKNMGNKFSNIFQPAYSALGINNSTNNLIEYNVFLNNENNKLNKKGYKTHSLFHSIYIAHYSKNNLIKNNKIVHCSGDPIRLRNGCHNNIFDENNIQKSGSHGFITEWYRTPEKHKTSPEEPSNSTVLKNNICKYSYPKMNNILITLYRSNVNNGALNNNYINKGNNFVIGTNN